MTESRQNFRENATTSGAAIIRVGSIAVAKKDTIGGNAGEMAVCWKIYTLDGQIRYCFIFESGEADNFSLEDAAAALHITDRVCASVEAFCGQHLGEMLSESVGRQLAALAPNRSRSQH